MYKSQRLFYIPITDILKNKSNGNEIVKERLALPYWLFSDITPKSPVIDSTFACNYFLLAVIKFPDKSNLWVKGLVWFTIPHALWHGNQGSRNMRELVTLYLQSRAESNELMQARAHFALSVLYSSGSNTQGWSCLQLLWVFSHQLE